MKITITNAQANEKNPKSGTVFFDTLIEIDGAAFIVQGWRFADGKMYTPQRRSGKAFYQTILCSPKFAQKVQEAALASGLAQMTTIEDDSWVTAKWGQNLVSSAIPESPEFAKELWEHYRNQKEN